MFSLGHQEGSVWVFTAQKFEGSRPFTVRANYEGFSEGSGFVAHLVIHLSVSNANKKTILYDFILYLNGIKWLAGIMVGDELIIDGGMASFEVVEKMGNDLRCKCTDPGLLLPRAKLSFWREGNLSYQGLPTLSTKVDL